LFFSTTKEGTNLSCDDRFLTFSKSRINPKNFKKEFLHQVSITGDVMAMMLHSRETRKFTATFADGMRTPVKVC
jgi:hypothetical protein